MFQRPGCDPTDRDNVINQTSSYLKDFHPLINCGWKKQGKKLSTASKEYSYLHLSKIPIQIAIERENQSKRRLDLCHDLRTLPRGSVCSQKVTMVKRTYPLKICSITSSALTLLWLDRISSGFCQIYDGETSLIQATKEQRKVSANQSSACHTTEGG